MLVMGGAPARRVPALNVQRDEETRCTRRDGAWLVERTGRRARRDVRGRAWSGGAVFAAAQRRAVGPLCKNGDATRAARSTPRRARSRRKPCRGDARATKRRLRVMGGPWVETKSKSETRGT